MIKGRQPQMKRYPQWKPDDPWQENKESLGITEEILENEIWSCVAKRIKNLEIEK